MRDGELDDRIPHDALLKAAEETARRDRETAARLQAAVEEQLWRARHSVVPTLATRHGRQV